MSAVPLSPVATPKPGRPPLASFLAGALPDFAVVLLFAPAVYAFGPVFGGPQGWIAAGGGVLLGALVALLARRLDWTLPAVIAATLIGYLLFGGALALPRTTIAGLVPTLDTLTRLVPLSVHSWMDLLTVSTPANSFTGPAVVPFLSGLVCSVAAVGFALRRRRLWSLLPPAILLVVAILWGTRQAPLAAAAGVVLAAGSLAWASWRAAAERRAANQELLVPVEGEAKAPSRLPEAAVALAVAALVPVLLVPIVGQGANRTILREHVTPPLNLQDYASPLTQYRYLEVDEKATTLFTVSGLPQGARVRLASLDTYDGDVYNVADNSAGFVRIGDTIDGEASVGTPSRINVAVSGYSGKWLPDSGVLRGITFAGANAKAQEDSLYYSAFGGTALTTVGVNEGDSYFLSALLPTRPSDADLAARSASGTTLPANSKVPELLAKLATDYIGDAKSPYDQLKRIEAKLADGYYSNGSDGKSRAGHTTERLTAMLSAPALVGDDEQYAVAMALMARQLGMPARVVMGFYPDAKAPHSDTWDVKGSDAHAWVEVAFDGAGWITFDPTPPRDRVPKTEVPKPQPQPKPQIQPPPNPPQNIAEDPLVNKSDGQQDKKDDANNALIRILMMVAAVIGGLALVSSPFLLILGLKAARRRSRRNDPDAAAQLSGGWAEIMDAATDLGVRTPTNATRRETAGVLASGYPEAGAVAVAARIDASVFGASVPTTEQAAQTWDQSQGVVQAMRAAVSRPRRALASISLRSLMPKGKVGRSPAAVARVLLGRLRGLRLPGKDPR